MLSFTDNMKLVLLNVGYSEPNENWNWSKIKSPFARIYYITGGSAVTNIAGVDHMLRPGRLYLTPPSTLHHDRSDGPFSLYYIHFFEITHGRQPLFNLLNLPVEVTAMPGDEELVKRLLRINPGRHLYDIDPEYYDNETYFSQIMVENSHLSLHVAIETQGILYQLLSRFIEGGGNPTYEQYSDDRVQRCVARIHEDLEKPLKVSELAQMCCLTTDHLTRIFRQETGFTPIDYINGLKMERAKLMILTTDNLIKDIAAELAIINISYFNRLFKQHTGHTPTQYRTWSGKPSRS